MASLILSPHYRSVIISMTSSELRYAFLKRCLFWGPYFEIRYGMQLSSPYWKRGFQKLLHHQFTNKLTNLITVDGSKPEEMRNTPGESFNSTKAKGLIEWSSPCDHQQGFRQLENVLNQFSFMVHFSSHLEALPPSTE